MRKIDGKRILITGGAGFIGSHLCERLIKESADLIVLDNFSTGKMSNLSEIKDEIEIIDSSVENYRNVEKAMKGCDMVIHEGFPYGKSGMGLDEQYINDGIIGTFNVLKSAVKNKLDRVVNISSVSAYGITEETIVSEEIVGEPYLHYGVTKLAGELYCKTFSKIYGLDSVSLRYFYVYGERYAQLDHNAMVNFLNRVLSGKALIIHGNGTQIRDYTYISDVVDGTMLALKSDREMKGDVYNISYGEGVTIEQLAKKISDAVDSKVEIKFADETYSNLSSYKYSDPYCIIPIGMTKKVEGKWVDERNYVGKITRAKEELGYNPKISLDKGIQKTLEWMRTLN